MAGDTETNLMSVDALFSIDNRRGYASNHLSFAAQGNVMPGMEKILLVAELNDAGKALYDKFYWYVVPPPLPPSYKTIYPAEDDGYVYECRRLFTDNLV